MVSMQKQNNQKYQYSLRDAFPSNLIYLEKQVFTALNIVIF